MSDSRKTLKNDGNETKNNESNNEPKTEITREFQIHRASEVVEGKDVLNEHDTAILDISETNLPNLRVSVTIVDGEKSIVRVSTVNNRGRNPLTDDTGKRISVFSMASAKNANLDEDDTGSPKIVESYTKITLDQQKNTTLSNEMLEREIQNYFIDAGPETPKINITKSLSSEYTNKNPVQDGIDSQHSAPLKSNSLESILKTAHQVEEKQKTHAVTSHNIRFSSVLDYNIYNSPYDIENLLNGTDMPDPGTNGTTTISHTINIVSEKNLSDPIEETAEPTNEADPGLNGTTAIPHTINIVTEKNLSTPIGETSQPTNELDLGLNGTTAIPHTINIVTEEILNAPIEETGELTIEPENKEIENIGLSDPKQGCANRKNCGTHNVAVQKEDATSEKSKNHKPMCKCQRLQGCHNATQQCCKFMMPCSNNWFYCPNHQIPCCKVQIKNCCYLAPTIDKTCCCKCRQPK